jgi:hypothetical protein
MQRRRLPMRAKLCAFIHSVALGHAAVGYLCFVRYIVLGSRNLEQVNARLIDWAVRIALVASFVQTSSHVSRVLSEFKTRESIPISKQQKKSKLSSRICKSAENAKNNRRLQQQSIIKQNLRYLRNCLPFGIATELLPRAPWAQGRRRRPWAHVCAAGAHMRLVETYIARLSMTYAPAATSPKM